jgi:hypothetical protein
MPTGKAGQRSTNLLFIKCKSFAEMNRCGGVIESERQDMHLIAALSFIRITITTNYFADHSDFLGLD